MKKTREGWVDLRNTALDVDQTPDPRCERPRSNGMRCKKDAVPGWNVCTFHMTEAERIRVKERDETTAQITKMRRFLTPISADDPDSNPLIAFSTEFRRAIARIRWYDERLAEVQHERDLIWGMVEQEEIGAAEWTGTNQKFAATEHMWLQLQSKERDRLMAMEKIWLSANLGIQQLELQKRVVASLDFAIQRIVQKLGIDIRDENVRKVVRSELLQLERQI